MMGEGQGVTPVATESRWEAAAWPWDPSGGVLLGLGVRPSLRDCPTPAARPLRWSFGGDLWALPATCQAFRAAPDEQLAIRLRTRDGGLLVCVCGGGRGRTGKEGCRERVIM